MFTQCSKCDTVFELSAEVLRTAGGQVRCGHCGEIFNALARLAEDDSGFHSGESQYDLESRADAILEGFAAPADSRDDAHADLRTEPHDAADTIDEDLPPGVEIAHLRILDEDGDEEDSLESSADTTRDDAEGIADDPAMFEFTLPPGELDRIFVESKGVPFIAMPPGLRPPRMAENAERPRAPVTPITRGDAAAPLAQKPPAPPVLTSATPGSAAMRTATALRTPVSGLTVPDHVRLGLLAGKAQRQAAALPDVPDVERRSAGWWAGAVALSVLLALQMMHENRRALASGSVLGPAVRTVYSSIGAEVALPVDLNAYQLRQWGVSAAPESSATLRVRASIMNVSSALKPFPLLRVSLANRYGAKLGSRNFEPREYMGKPVVRMLAPGERIDATVDILDPAQEAEGFEINVCLRATDKKISCAGDSAAGKP